MPPRKPPIPLTRSPARARTTDSFQNAAARLGVARGNDNLISQGSYTFDPITRNRVLLEAMYRSSWVVRRVVGVVAEDMTKAGVDFRGEAPPEDLKKVRSRLTRSGSWRTLTQGLKWGRLYGGAVSMMLIRGQDPQTPLRVETVAPGAFQGLRTYDRWQLAPIPGEVVQEPGPEQGQPVFYRVVPYGGNNASPEGQFVVHHSRLIRHEGDDLPVWQRQTEQGWGMSVIEPIYDRLISFDSTTMGAAQLVFRAHLRTLKIANWKKNLALGGDQAEGALAEIDFVRRFQQLEGITVLDATSDLSAQSYNFAGLDSVLTQMGAQIAGGAGIPQVKIFGQSPGGFSSGDADLQSYHDDINSSQEHDLRLGLSRLFQVVYWSECGHAPPPDFDFDFAALAGMSEDEKAGLAQSRGTTVMNAFTSQVIKKSTTLKELQAIGAETGTFASITDDDVKQAEEEEEQAKVAAQQQAALAAAGLGTPGGPAGGPGSPEGGDGGPAGGGGPDDLPPGFQGPSDASGGGDDDGDLPEGFQGAGGGDDEDLPQGFRDAASASPDDVTWEQLEAIFGKDMLRYAGIKGTQDAWEESKHKRGNAKNAGQFSSTGGGGAKPKKESVGAQKLKALGVGHDHILVAGTSNTKKYDAYKTVKDYVDAHPKGKETALRILAMDYLSGHIKFKHPESGELVHSGNTPGKAGKVAPPESKPEPSPKPKPDSKPKGTLDNPTDTTGWKKVGDKKGSNAGGTYEDESGQQHYIKETKSSDHQRSELLAEALYQKLGVATLERTAHKLDGKPAVGAPLAKLKRFDPYDPEHRAEAQKDFVAHAFLGNWDAVGQSYDNLAFKDGKLAQIDAGGSLRYRAQGGIKSFTSSVGELDSLRSSSTSPQGHQVFGGMTPEQIKQSAEPVLKLSDADIKQLTSKFIEDSGDANEMAEKLIGRREDIRKRVAALTAPKPPMAPLAHDDHERWSKAGGVKTWVLREESQNHTEELHAAYNSAGLPLHKSSDNEMVRYYTGSGAYELNAGLRSGKPGFGHESAIKKLDEIVNASKFKEDTIVYRGFGGNAQVQMSAPPPTEFQDDGYSSVSFNPGVSRDFGTSKSLYRVRIPEGFPGAAFARGDRNVKEMLHDEAEVVLPRGTIYKIVKRTPNAAYGGTHDIVDVVAYHPSMG